MSSGAPVEVGTTIKYPSAALLCVDSNDQAVFNNGVRVDDKNPSQIYINKQSPMLFGYMTRIALTEVNINWSTPNVNPRNNTLTMAVQSSSGFQFGRLTIPVGFYKPTELATVVMTEFKAVFGDFINLVGAGNPLSVTYSDVTCSFTFAALSENPPTTGTWDSFTFGVLPGIKYPLDAPDIPVALPAVEDDLTQMMGLGPVTEELSVTTLTLNGGFASMMYSPYIDVVSNFLTKNQNVTDGDSAKVYTSSKLARIYLSNEMIEARTEDNIPGVRPFVFRREFKFPKQIQWNSTENIDVIDISVLDYKGNPIYITPLEVLDTNEGDEVTIGNQADIQFTLQVTEV